MPIYVYECKNGHKQDELRSISDRHKLLKCDKCNKHMKLIVTGCQPPIWKPVTLEHIEPSGQPRTFNTRQELKSRCDELGVESSALL